MLSALVLFSASDVLARKVMKTNLTEKAKAVIQLSPEEMKQSARSTVLPTKKKNANAVLQKVQKQAAKIVRTPKKRVEEIAPAQ